jgi:hypothetical protein
MIAKELKDLLWSDWEEPARWSGSRRRARVDLEQLETRLLLSNQRVDWAHLADIGSPLASAVAGASAGVAGSQDAGSEWASKTTVSKVFFSAPVKYDGLVFVSDTGGDTNAPDPDSLDSMSTTLPFVPTTGVVGNLAPTDSLDLYKISLDPGSAYFKFTVTAVGPSRYLPGRLWLLDANGNLIGDWRVPHDTSEMTIALYAVRPPTDPFMVFGVSHGDDVPAPGSPPFNYEIVVARAEVAAPEGSFTAPNSPSSIATITPIVGGGPTNTISIGLGGGTTVSDSVLPIESASPAAVATPLPAATSLGSSLRLAPLPTRFAAPTGGLLAAGHPAPPVDQLAPALVDLTLVGMESDPNAPTVWDEPRLSISPASEGPAESPRLVALQGSGGFPVIAAGVVAHQSVRKSAGPAPMLLPLLGSPDSDNTSQSATVLRTPVRHGTTPILDPTGCRNDKSPGEKPRAVSNDKSPSMGFHVAATLAFGMLLPELVATFQSVRATGSRFRLRLRRARRNKRRKAE